MERVFIIMEECDYLGTVWDLITDYKRHVNSCKFVYHGKRRNVGTIVVAHNHVLMTEIPSSTAWTQGM